MVKPSLLIYSERLAILLSKDSLNILFMLRGKNCRLKELSGNSFTKSKRLKELKVSGLIESIIMNQDSKERAVVGYKLTDKGENILKRLDELFEII